jgi:hypothetical protein
MKRKQISTSSFLASIVFCLSFAVSALAQAAPTPAPTMPPGMKGANVNDPRAKLSAGLYDAGETALGIKHVTLLKKPEAFDLGIDPNGPKMEAALKVFGIADGSQIPPAVKMSFAGLAFANSDLAFQGNHLFLGNFYGINIYDIADPAKTRLITSLICPGGQGDVSVYRNLLFMSVEMQNGRLDCGEQGFPIPTPPAAGQEPQPVAEKDRFRGVRIFDISDIKNPKQVAAVQTCRGSHTHTLVTDPKDKANVYIYVSGTSNVRPAEELAGCSGGPPDKDPNTAFFRIEVIKVPLAAPQDSKIVSTPRIFGDPATGAINVLKSGATHGTGRPAETDQCHDITVYPEIGLAAGACSGNGILLDIRDPANPKRVEAVNDPNYAYWHSASFSNDGKKVVFTDEWGGGMAPRCRENDPDKWGANAIFRLAGTKLTFANYYKLSAAQTETENCVAHNGSLVPVPGRDIKVQSWYQGGISVMDFTDADKPVEIAYFDRGPIDAKIPVMGGFWSSYWYNGHIYASEIARGLDIFELTPTPHLTQNEIDAAKTVRMDRLNVQAQERMEWPKSLIVAKAYLDQLERSGVFDAKRLTELRQAIQKADGSASERGKLKNHASSLEKSASTAKNGDDAARLRALAEILKSPAA